MSRHGYTDDWNRVGCTHAGIGLPGCELCDPSARGPSPGAGNRCPATAWSRWGRQCEKEAGHTGTRDASPGAGTWIATEQQAWQTLDKFFTWERPDAKSDDEHDQAQEAYRVVRDSGPGAGKAEPSLIERIEVECNTVNGTYNHPEQLESAVCKAFDRIRDLLRAARAAT
jgi:hypothetical protein